MALIRRWAREDLCAAVEADLAWLGAYVDWHPVGGALRLTGGLLLDVGSVDAVGVARDDLQLPPGLDPDALGRIVGSASFDGPVPYAGVGWGRALGGTRRWALLVDVGAAWPRDVSVDLRVEGPLAPLEELVGLLGDEEADLEARLNDELDDWRPYPLVQLRLLRRF